MIQCRDKCHPATWAPISTEKCLNLLTEKIVHTLSSHETFFNLCYFSIFAAVSFAWAGLSEPVPFAAITPTVLMHPVGSFRTEWWGFDHFPFKILKRAGCVCVFITIILVDMNKWIALPRAKRWAVLWTRCCLQRVVAEIIPIDIFNCHLLQDFHPSVWAGLGSNSLRQFDNVLSSATAPLLFTSVLK